jgi:hypothetical protein
LKNEIEKKKQHELTYQIHDLSHKTEITLSKVNKKKDLSQLRLTCQNQNPSHEIRITL